MLELGAQITDTSNEVDDSLFTTDVLALQDSSSSQFVNVMTALFDPKVYLNGVDVQPQILIFQWLTN